ncbi:ABC transporter substrate-binding protein [bacterium]|nr:ABC transporter substrate-binding protein [bacterium]
MVVGLILDDDRRSSIQVKSAESSKKVEIVFWHAMSGPLGVVMDELIQRFNQSQPSYSVRAISMGSYDTLAKKLLASLVANNAPDISQNYETLTKKFIKHGKIVCLDNLIGSESELIKEDIIPVLLDNNTFDGKLWSFPFNKSVPALYYNKDLFRKAGLDPEKPPSNWDEVASFSRKILSTFGRDQTGKPEVYGFATTRGNVWMFECRVLQYNGKLVSEKEARCHFSESASVKALAILQDLLKEDLAFEGQGYDPQNDFKSQRVAMLENTIVSKVHMEEGIKFDWGISPLPGGATKAVILAGTNINIFNNGSSEKIRGAWEFIKWFTSPEITAEWSVRTTYLPVRRSSLKSKIIKEALERDPNLYAPYVQLDYCYFEPRLSNWFEIRDLMADFLERATLEMGPPEHYLKQMTKDIDGILSHAQE